MIYDLLNNRIDVSFLVISKGITKNIDKTAEKGGYKVKSAHVELAKKMRKRDPSFTCNIGDRIPYVIVKGTKRQKAYELSEDPLYAM